VCKFQSLSATSLSKWSPPEFAINSTTLSCLLPNWPESATANLTLYALSASDAASSQHEADPRQLTLLPFFANAQSDSRITFQSFWTSLSPTEAVPAKGGSIITVIGRGFRASANYTCQFEDSIAASRQWAPALFVAQLHTADNVSATQVSVTCQVPSLSPLLDVGVDLLEDGKVVQVLATAPLRPWLLSLFQGWDVYYFNSSAAYVFDGDAAGADLFVQGYGFQKASLRYWCSYLNETNGLEVFQVPALVKSSMLLQCGRIQQDFVEHAATLILTIWQSSLHNISAPRLRVPFTDNGMTTKQENSACAPANKTCSIRVMPTPATPPPVLRVWTSLDPREVFGGEGQRITVVGQNFEPHAVYICRFDQFASNRLEFQMICNTTWCTHTCVEMCAGAYSNATANSECMFNCTHDIFWQGSPAIFLNEATIICDVPRCQPAGSSPLTIWHQHQNQQLQVLFPYVGPRNGTNVRFTERWYGLEAGQVTVGVASGGTELHLKGCGFNTINHTGPNYTCIFSRTNGGVYEQSQSLATVLNFEEMRCVTPAWGASFAAAQVPINLASTSGFVKCHGISACNPEFEFTSLVLDIVWTESSVARLSAAGGSVFFIRGTGFNRSAKFECIFAYRDYEQVMTNCSVVDSSVVDCTSDVWNFSAVENVSVSFRHAGQPMQVDTFANASVGIDEVFSHVSNTVGGFEGGTQVLVHGNGFRVESHQYACVFGNSSNATHSAAVVHSNSQLTCTSPLRTAPSASVALTIVSHAAALRHHLAYFQYLSAVTSASHAVVDRLSGTTLRLGGGGFIDSFQYLCELILEVPGENEFQQTGELQPAKINQQTALTRISTLQTERASCACTGGCRTLTHGAFSDGSEAQQEYAGDLFCYWVLAPVNASRTSSLKISFDRFAVEAPWDHVSIYTCDSEDSSMACVSPVLFVALTGHGLPHGTYLVVPSGRVLVTFETDDLLSAQGFSASFEPYSLLTMAIVENSTRLVCPIPSWDLSTPSRVFASRQTRLRVFENTRRMLLEGSRRVTSDMLSWREISDDLQMTFVHINRAPWFAGHDLHLPADEVEQTYTFESWAGVVSAGVHADDKTTVEVERDQAYTFELTLVSVSTPALLISPPELSHQGQIRFSVRANMFGVAIIQVRLFDDGGNAAHNVTDFAPISSTVKRFAIHVYAPSKTARTVDFAVPATIQIFEGSGNHIMLPFLKQFSSGVPHPQVCLLSSKI